MREEKCQFVLGNSLWEVGERGTKGDGRGRTLSGPERVPERLCFSPLLQVDLKRCSVFFIIIILLFILCCIARGGFVYGAPRPCGPLGCCASPDASRLWERLNVFLSGSDPRSPSSEVAKTPLLFSDLSRDRGGRLCRPRIAKRSKEGERRQIMLACI